MSNDNFTPRACGGPVPLERVISKLDAHLARSDYAAAERHLQYWLAEAELCGDGRGKLALLNEQVGLYRKTGREQECLDAAGAALALCGELGLQDTVTHGTTLVNAATGHKAFGRAKEAWPLYRRAREIYERLLPADDARLGGLYNNMALALTDLRDYRAAEDLYRRAIGVMQQQKNGELEVAITHLNLADLSCARRGTREGGGEARMHLDMARELLRTPGLPEDGYTAFVCEKCAPVFGAYGDADTERELMERARAIYERT